MAILEPSQGVFSIRSSLDRLDRREFLVEAFLGNQLRMGTSLHNFGFIDHQDLIRMLNGAEAVSDDQGGPTAH